MITSAGNERLKNLKKLMLHHGDRKKQGLYSIEGIKLFTEAPKESIAGVYISAHMERRLMDGELSPEVLARLKEIKYQSVKDEVFNKITDTKTPQGIITLIKIPTYNIKDITGEKTGRQAFIIVLESIQDPGNMGTIIRSAEAAGATGVLVNPSCADPYSPKCVRASAGSIYRMPVLCVQDLCREVKHFRDKGFSVMAAHLKGSVDYTAPDCKKPLLLLIGNEGKGLSSELSGLSTEYVRIPMEGKVESLNAGIAATVLMYEVYRQRRSQ